MLTNGNHSRLPLIGYYIGFVTVGVGVIQAIPLVTALLYAELSIACDFVIGAAVAVFTGSAMMRAGMQHRTQRLSWGEGMVVAAGSWFLGMLLCAIPYYLSGNYASYLDCCFDIMSGFTTTGMVLIRDLDHVSNGINMWRHLLTFVGGQGMVVLALTFLTKGSAYGAYKIYAGEGKDERLVPNAVNTAKHIWLISMIYLVLGSLVLWFAGLLAGMPVDRSLLHGIWVFMSAWSTGGFAPQTQSILYYHSAFFEVATMVFFIIGSFNFALHYAVLTGKRNELRKNVETVSFVTTVTILTLVVTLGLLKLNVYTDTIAMFRKGFYQLISGHTTTGFMTVYAKQFFYEWGDIALFGMLVAMMFGGSACSTAGGFKGLRIGIIFTSFKKEIKRIVMPESVVSVEEFHHIKDTVLDDGMVRSAFLIVTAYMMTFAVATLIGMLWGYPFASAAFESASVTGNVGLSIGVVNPVMPAVLKITYIMCMWLGRLEFMSILALGVYIAMRVKKRCEKRS
jgi:trk system potassium uptake protein TrkH